MTDATKDKAVYRWIEDAVKVLKHHHGQPQDPGIWEQIDTLLAGVPTPNVDLGFDSPADRAARTNPSAIVAPNESPLAWVVFTPNDLQGHDYYVFPDEDGAKSHTDDPDASDPIPLYRHQSATATESSHRAGDSSSVRSESAFIADYQRKIERDAATIKGLRDKLAELCDRLGWKGPSRGSNIEITVREARALVAEHDRIAAGVAFITDTRLGGS